MSSFPLMSELPQFLNTKGWCWRKAHISGVPSYDFWIGTDTSGNEWLTKLRGSFCAYREIVFAHLAQAMNWSCQSSIFIILDVETAQFFGCDVGEIHAAHWYMQEHYLVCEKNCALKKLNGVSDVDNLPIGAIDHIIDWPKSEIAADLFGANECSGKFFTVNHEFVIIDSEQMFSTCSQDLNLNSWVLMDNMCSIGGYAVAVEVCREITSLPNTIIQKALEIPKGIYIDERWSIGERVNGAIKYASISIN